MVAKTSRRLLVVLFALSAALHAQQGDREGHDMTSFVPEDVIPPAPFLSPEAALKSFEIAPGFVLEIVAAEPLVEMPVTLKFDGDGRMWVCEMRGYMPDIDGKGEDIPQGRIVILEDTDRDGSVDKRTVFLDKLLLPRSIYLLDDGILWADQTSLYFQGRDGDQPRGAREVVDADYAKGGNVEHKANSLILGLDNWIYNAKSDRRYKRADGKWVTEKTFFRGQWGIDRDDFGRLYHNNNSLLLMGDYLLPNAVFGNPGAKVKSRLSSRLGSNAVHPIRVTPGVNRGYQQGTLSRETYKLNNATGASGMAIYRGENFPPEMYGMAFVTEPCGNLVKAIRISEGEGTLTGDHPYGEKEFLASTDERFRPVNAYSAPDGCLYILDMYHGIIQHKTYVTTYLRKQITDRGLDGPPNGHGRIYRVRHMDKPRGAAPQLENLAAAELVKFLAHPNGWWRDTAHRLIVERGDPALAKPLEAALRADAKPLVRLHAFWCLEGLGLLTPEHVAYFLKSGHEKLASSALYAANSLGDSARRELLSTVASFEAGPESSIYLARFLAGLADADAMNLLVGVLRKHGKEPLVREAAIAGLAGREAVFIGVNNGRYKHEEFDKWLHSAMENRQKKVEPPKITGAHLASFKRGEELYMGLAGCIGCHGADGAGMPNLGPPLDESDWVTGTPERLGKILLHGLQGPITVSGERYEPPTVMPGLAMNPTISDQNIADILTFIRHAWSNRAEPVAPATVTALREQTKDRNGALYTESELE